MFDKLIEWLISIIKDLLPFFIVDEYNQVVLLRGGIFYKLYSKGFYFKIPFLDYLSTQHIVITTMDLPSQSLVTIDEKNIVVKGMVKYKIVDVKTFTLEVYNAKSAISDVAQGIIKEIMMSSTWLQCIDPEIDNTITKKLRAEIKKFGVQVEKVTLTNIGIIRSIRLFNENENPING